MESWKYYNFKKIKPDIFDLPVSQSHLKFIFSDQVDTNIIIIEHNKVILSETLKEFCEVSILDKSLILNEDSTLDRRISNINFQSECLKLKFQNFIKPSEPLKIKYISTPDQFFFPSIQIEVQNSKFILFEDFSQTNSPLSSCHLQIKLRKSSIEHIVLHHLNKENLKPLFQNQEISLHESQYTQNFFSIKRDALRQQISVSMNTPDCQTHLNGFNVSDDGQFSEVRSEVMHHAPCCNSHQLFKTLVSGRGTSVFNGRIFVDRKAQKTDSSQLCQGVLLSPQAQINAKPELEIYADDVKASHGAAIGQIGSDQVFYLVSRGMSYDEAYNILAQSYAGEIINQITNPQLRLSIHKILFMQIKDISKQFIESLR